MSTSVARERVYGGRSPDERRRERRDRLLAAGLSVFGTTGFAGATIPALCAHAGVTTRHFYDDFDTRESLLIAVYDEIIAGTVLAVASALEHAPEDPRERTRASLSAFLRSYLDDPRRGRVACIEVVGVSPELEKRRRAVIHQFARVIAAESEETARRGGLPKKDYRLSSIGMAGATNELVIEWLTSETRPPIDDLCDELIALYISVLEGAKAAVAYVDQRRAAHL